MAKIRKQLRKLLTGSADQTPDEDQPEDKRTLLDDHLRYTYGDQKGQVDFLINNVFDYENRGLPKSGYFIDLACADGVHINNTYFLERYLGWSGILFEPNPAYRPNIEKERTSTLVTKCVTDEVGATVRFRVDNGMLGGIVSDDTDNNEITRSSELQNAEIIDIETTTLAHELEAAGAPNEIGFLSLDIEGAEWIAMRSFPFDRYKFRCMAIERPNKELDLMLERHGYRQIAHLRYDVLYTHCDDLSLVNLNPKLKFAFTPEKTW